MIGRQHNRLINKVIPECKYCSQIARNRNRNRLRVINMAIGEGGGGSDGGGGSGNGDMTTMNTSTKSFKVPDRCYLEPSGGTMPPPPLAAI